MQQLQSHYLMFILTVAFLTGCGERYPEVSGRITSHGEPVAGVRVLFVPVSTTDNPFPGPYAEGTTDAEGRYSLVARGGSNGATPGLNQIELRIAAANELEFLRSELELLQLTSGRSANPDADARMHELTMTIENLECDGSRDALSAEFTSEFTVPESGTSSADFELSDLSGT
ncbi:MAG: carboxypeptidase-like regulatory domain-containing protein [Planctomycetota bacterium]